jgi:hypothetical protein
MRIVLAGIPSHVRQWVGGSVLAACAIITGCAHSGPRPMVGASGAYSGSVTPTTEPQTAPTTPIESPSSDTHATTLPSTGTPTASSRDESGTEGGRAVTSNGAEMVHPQGQLIQAEGPPKSSVDFSATGTYLYGSVRGSAQVPSGGRLGTSNADRPQFHSIGLNTANIADVEVSANAHQYGEFFGGAQIIQLSGAAFIGNKPLITGGINYAPFSHVSSDIGLNWYRFGYRYTIPIDTAQNGVPDITFTPYAEGVIWDFDYNLTVPKRNSVHRSFTEGGAQVGAIFAWRPNGGPLSLEATLGGFPQASHLANISVESLDLRYHFYDLERFNFSGLLGVTWEQQDFRDTQKLPNHISVDFGPMLTAGLQLQF